MSVSVHYSDHDGNPAGGHTIGTGIEINWQDGPLVIVGGDDEVKRLESNGAFVENVIQAAISRLEYFQESKFRCRENALAITKLEEALHWLDHRTTKARAARGVEGTHEP